MRILTAAFAISCAAILLGCASGGAPTTSGAAPAPSAGELDGGFRARQALSRLTFGPRPGDFAAIERIGADAWIARQLRPEQIADDKADEVLASLETQRKKAFELLADHPPPEELNQRMQARTAVTPGGVAPGAMMDSTMFRRSQQTAQQTAQALTTEIATAKVLRASVSERQLLEIMVDFWENHFSVAIGKSPNRYSMVEYDRDVIRPLALGKFRDLLGAVAHSPQMLYYLDNWQSSVDSLHPTMAEERLEARRRSDAARMASLGDTTLLHVINRRRNGLNENYARELMELHTLGVDGGYTQHDVVDVARCLSGWTIDRPDLGGGFMFRPDAHDAGEKMVLGTRIAAGRGVEDGEQVLDILAKHPSTARFIARKLVIRLVSDSAPPALVDRAAKTFMQTDGDIREVVRTIVTSPEFFSRAAYRAKVKTPFEFVVSVVRSMGSPPDTTPSIAGTIGRLGQPIYGRQTPDGWPDNGAAWMNAGALLNRMNFGAQVGNGQVKGLVVAKWEPAEGLAALGPAAEVQGVVAAVLGGDAAAGTRQAMMAAARVDGRAPMKRLGDVIAVAIGSPEFQRR